MAVVLDQTILYPQGGGQPFDTGSIEAVDGTIKFCVTDVRAKSGVVSFESLLMMWILNFRSVSGLPTGIIKTLFLRREVKCVELKINVELSSLCMFQLT